MGKEERTVLHTSVRPYLAKKVIEEAGEGSKSAIVSNALDEHFDPDFGLDQAYLKKLHEVAIKEKRDPKDMVRFITELYLDKVRFVKVFG